MLDRPQKAAQRVAKDNYLDDVHVRMLRVTEDLRVIQRELNCAAMQAPGSLRASAAIMPRRVANCQHVGENPSPSPPRFGEGRGRGFFASYGNRPVPTNRGSGRFRFINYCRVVR